MGIDRRTTLTALPLGVLLTGTVTPPTAYPGPCTCGRTPVAVTRCPGTGEQLPAVARAT